MALSLLLLLGSYTSASAQLPAAADAAAGKSIPQIVQLAKANEDLSLRPLWQWRYSGSTSLNPQSVWDAPASAFKTGDDTVKMQLNNEQAYIARFHIQEMQSDFSFYVTVPVPSIDQVRLWWRPSDGSSQWRSFQAGDRVSLDNWPFVGPYPAFELPGKHQGLDVVMRFESQAPQFVRAYSQSNKLFHSERSLYSNGTGGSLGLIGAMTLICMMTLLLQRAEFFWLALSCLNAFFLYVARSGVGFISFWPGFAEFNNVALYFFATISAVSMTVVISYLLPNFHGVKLMRWSYIGWSILGLVAAFSFWLGLGYATTVWVFRTYAAMTLLFCFALPLFLAFWRGDRVSTWVSASLLGLMACAGAQIYSMYLATPMDTWGIASSVGWMFAAMGLFAAAFGKYQYGHTVLGDQINLKDERDHLTGLLNAKGFEQSMSLTVLAAGQKRDLAPIITLMMCRLPSIERQEFDSYGKTVSNQAEVRLASSIKHALPETSVVARVQRGCLVIFVTERVTPKIVEAAATKIISDVLNAEDLPNFVSELGLQILVGQVPSHRLSSGVFQALHAYGEAHEYENKTIHWVELSSTTKPVR
ncbi:MAG: 7TM-DISM domain-containing protein [Brachymonas sp.]